MDTEISIIIGNKYKYHLDFKLLYEKHKYKTVERNNKNRTNSCVNPVIKIEIRKIIYFHIENFRTIEMNNNKQNKKRNTHKNILENPLAIYITNGKFEIIVKKIIIPIEQTNDIQCRIFIFFDKKEEHKTPNNNKITV